MSLLKKIKAWWEEEFSTPYDSAPTSTQGVVKHIDDEITALDSRVKVLETAEAAPGGMGFTAPIGISQPAPAIPAAPVATQGVGEPGVEKPTA